MSRPYSISLLNDLHEIYPDLLYRPARFHNVQDVLNYIIAGANQNPYERARTQYEATLPPEPIRLPARSGRAASQSLHDFVQGAWASQNDIIITSLSDPIRSPPRIPRLPVSAASGDAAISAFINQLLDPRAVANPLASFLDDRVIIRPTPEQLEQHTQLIQTIMVQSDHCAICQDVIDAGQMMRTLNHCHHSFHQECIDIWFTTRVSCPTCRHDIREP